MQPAGTDVDSRSRLAAVSLLANIEALGDEGLDAAGRARATALAESLRDDSGDLHRVDRRGRTATIDELRSVLAPAHGMTASTVLDWLDDLDAVAG